MDLETANKVRVRARNKATVRNPKVTKVGSRGMEKRKIKMDKAKEKVIVKRMIKLNLDQVSRQFSQFASTNMALNVPDQTRVMVEAAARLQGELIATRAQLEGLKETYTAENIRVKSVQAHVNELERELAKMNGRSGSSAVDPTNPYPSVKNLPLLGVKWADLYRDSKIRETVVELLTQQYEVARIQEAKEIPTVKVLDPASTPERKRPSWVMILVGGALMGGALACLGYFIKGWWDRWDRDDPRRMLLAQFVKSGQGTANSVRNRLQKPAVKSEHIDIEQL